MKPVVFDSEAKAEFDAAAAYYEAQRSVFFLELDDRIWIAAVAHQRRRPGYWAHRQAD